MDRTEKRARLEFRKEALAELRKAYLALLKGGVKSYTIADRSLTRLDLGALAGEIKELEDEIDELEAGLFGKRPRKAFSVVPRNW